MWFGFDPKSVTYQDTGQSRNSKDKRQIRATWVQVTVWLFVYLKGKLIFRFGLLIAGCRIVGDCLILVDAKKTRIRADKTFIKNQFLTTPS